MLDFRSYLHVEEYQNSFKYLDAELIQLSKGSFDSLINTFIHNEFVLDRRVTGASHMHHCNIQLGAINFVFINSFRALNINGIDISKDSQIAVSGGENLSAIIHGKLDISTVSLPTKEFLHSTPPNFIKSGSITTNAIRTALFCPNQKEQVHYLVNRYIKYLRINHNPPEQLILDMFENLTYQLAQYLESNKKTKTSKKKRLSTQELSNVHDLIVSTEVLSLKALQSVCNCSPRTFNNLINKHFECTPNQLVSIIRLNRIKRYLGEYSTERKSIKHICEKFGVHSQFRLSRSYKELFGKSIPETLTEKRV